MPFVLRKLVVLAKAQALTECRCVLRGFLTRQDLVGTSTSISPQAMTKRLRERRMGEDGTLNREKPPGTVAVRAELGVGHMWKRSA